MGVVVDVDDPDADADVDIDSAAYADTETMPVVIVVGVLVLLVVVDVLVVILLAIITLFLFKILWNPFVILTFLCYREPAGKLVELLLCAKLIIEPDRLPSSSGYASRDPSAIAKALKIYKTSK